MRNPLVLVFVLFCSGAFASSDLILSSLRAVPGRQSLQITMTIRNDGPDDAEQPAGNIYLYEEERLILSQNITLKPIPAGGSNEEMVTVPVPSPATMLKVEVYDEKQSDHQPSSNSKHLSLSPADVRSTDLELTEAAILNKQPLEERIAHVKAKIRNNGPNPVASARVKAELTIFNNVIVQKEKGVGLLNPGQEEELRIALVLPPAIPGADAYVQLRLLPVDSQVIDSAEFNNVYSIPVRLTPKMPDLSIKDIRIDSKGSLNFTVTNKGLAPAQESVTALYLNGALTERFATPKLQPNGSQKFIYKDHPVAKGTQVSVVVDFNADVPEASEVNNRTNLLVR